MTAPTVRKRRNRVVTRQSQDVRVGDILKAARAIIGQSGYEGVTVAEIAERAGIVEGTVYRYFKSKEELLLKVADLLGITAVEIEHRRVLVIGLRADLSEHKA